jgi:hypothetical protein
VSRGELHESERALGEVCTGAPSPVDLAVSKDDRETLALRLNDRVLERILSLLMEGETHAEIARKMPMSISAVERRVKVIRSAWQKINSMHV